MRDEFLPGEPVAAASSSRRRVGRAAGFAALLGLAALFGHRAWTDTGTAIDRAATTAQSAAPPPLVTAPQTPSVVAAAMLDPRPALPDALPGMAAAAPLPPVLLPAPKPARAARAPVATDKATTGSIPAAPAKVASLPPLPAPRPADLRTADAAARVATRRPPRRARVAAVAAPAEDNRTFWEKLLGLDPFPSAAPAPTLSYAALNDGPLRVVPERRAAPAPSAGVAIYDISAATLTLPGGERLEAHSGLGERMDDPRFVHVRMKGATPPGTYDLTERESLFHGVRAIRLNPVGGSGAIFGRAGLLAHSYLLGPNGDSNGCISVRDYDRFLQAFLNGEIRQVVVVAGARGDAVPTTVGRRDRAGQPRAG